MKRFAILLAATGIAACSSEPAAEPTPEATETVAEAPATAETAYVGTWEATMEDGSKESTVINPDLTYVDNDPKAGETKGTFAVKDGKACFAPDDGKPETCWTVGEPDADGVQPATADDGTKITVKKTA